MNAEQILQDVMATLLLDVPVGDRQRQIVAAIAEFKQRVNALDQLDGKFAGLVWRKRDGQVEESFVVFVPRDQILVPLLGDYRGRCRQRGCEDSHLQSIGRLTGRVEDWQAEHPAKLPDTMPGETP